MCCGKSPTILPAAAGSGWPAGPASHRAHRTAARFASRYEYTGPTRLTVRAPQTGRTYVFDRPGAVLDVDPADAPALAAVPGLRPLQG